MCGRWAWSDDPLRIACHGSYAFVDQIAFDFVWLYPNGDAVCAGIRKDNSTFLCMCNYWSGRNFSHTCRWITEFFSCMHCDGIVGECCAGFFVHILLWMGNPGSSLGDLPSGNSQCGHSFVVFAVPLSGI